jgi:hypothetical protein
MTYEERQRYQELREQLEELKQELAEADPARALTRGEARRLLELVEAALDTASPERWDNLMETIASEITRRVGGMTAPL